MKVADALILTLRFDEATFDRLDGLRRTYFPPERNVVPAHVTLFHDLPGDFLADISMTLAEVCEQTPLFVVKLPRLRFLGAGVAVEVDSPELSRLRKTLASGWAAWLTPQDRQPFKPHVTLQNKVTPDVARRTFEFLSGGWESQTAGGVGLTLWHYRGGPWELAADFAFRAAGRS
jgi:2'-5' RNA ligase